MLQYAADVLSYRRPLFLGLFMQNVSELYVVVNLSGGYTRDDQGLSNVVGIFTHKEIAEHVKSVSGPSAHIQEVKLKHIHPGLIHAIKEIRNIDILELSMNIQASLIDLSDRDKECLMSAEEFESEVDHYMICESDGEGYWATSKKVSEISCFEPRPEWATHVCWYNN